MNLLPHNQEAYEKLKKSFETNKKVAIVQPTGTGKMYIYLKWLLDNKDKASLLVVPNTTIFYQLKKTLEENNLTKEDFPNLKFTMYSQLLNWDEENFNQKYDFIILDELHRSGAPKWYEVTNKLLEKNKEAKVLGLTATPTRYVDGKNMVEEIFNNNIASEMTLAEAIVKKILPFPTYVNTFYSKEEISKEINRLQNKINQLSIKNSLLNELDKVKGNLADYKGLSDIFEKHITNINGHYVVFCKDINHLEEMKTKVSEWFTNKKVTVYDVHYHKTDQENEISLTQFENNQDDSLKLLFSIEKLNEGLHLKNIDGVIMLRRTSSHIIYLQQVGRALSCSNDSNPLIIDVVNNLNSYVNFYQLKKDILEYCKNNNILMDEELERQISNFTLYDYINDLVTTLKNVDDALNKNDLQKLDIIKQYINEGNTYESIKYNTTYQNYPIGRWITEWRYDYRKKELKENIANELKQLGEQFNQKEMHFLPDEEKIKILEEYLKTNQYEDIIFSTIYNGYPIGQWMMKWRKDEKAGNLNQIISIKLRQLGENFEPKATPSLKLEEKFRIIQEYLSLGNKYEDITMSTKYKDYSIGIWIRNYKYQYKNGMLDQQIIDFLTELGETFEPKREKKKLDEEKINIINEYLNLGNSYTSIIQSTLYKQYPIGDWINKFRKKYKANTLNKTTELSLRQLGETFEQKIDIKRNDIEKLIILKEYLSLGNDYNSIVQSTMYQNYPIGEWIKKWRNQYNANTINPDTMEVLKQLGETFIPKRINIKELVKEETKQR